MRHGIVHLLILICFAACFYGCRSPRSVTRKTVTEATGEEKQTTTDGVIELARRDSSHEEHVLDVYREDSTHIRIDYDSLGRIKEIVWGIERSGFFNGRGKWAKGFENQRV